MAFKMKGSPHKMGTIQGTSSTLKQKNETPLEQKEKTYSSSSNRGYSKPVRKTEKHVEGKGKKEKIVQYEKDDEGTITKTVSKSNKSGDKTSTKSKTPKTKLGQAIANVKMKRHTKKAKKSGDTGVGYDKQGNKVTTSIT
jgi:hypothetical protein